MNEREDELKPCPFCGGKSMLSYEKDSSLGVSYVYIGCTVCTGRVLGGADEWNARQKTKNNDVYNFLSNVIKSAFPILEDEGLDEIQHHCEWSIQQERKRLHALLLTKKPKDQPR